MAKPDPNFLGRWNDVVDQYHSETDRGAAVLAAGFVENCLGEYLRSLTVDEKVAKGLFGSLGPLSSFNQRIAVAYSFGFVSKEQYDDLDAMRQIRNYFAHHPFEATFRTEKIDKLCSQLSTFSMAEHSKPKNDREKNRNAYLFACALMHMNMMRVIQGHMAVKDLLAFRLKVNIKDA